MMKRLKWRTCGAIFLLGILTIAIPDRVFAQKNATSIFGSTPRINKIDESIACADTSSQIGRSKYCALYKKYDANYETDPETAAGARNQMLDLVKVDLDAFFDEYKNKRVTRTKWFETLFDFLGIAGDLGGAIINGERVKSIISSSSGALQSGRNSMNKNFRLLEYQVMINQMIADRTNQWTRIIGSKQSSPSEYSWDAAKGDLLQYLTCGTFNNSLNSLAENTGTDVAEARVVQATTEADLASSASGRNALRGLSKGLANNDAKVAALATLQAIVVELRKNAELKQGLDNRGITDKSDGPSIIKALIEMRRELTIAGKDDLVKVINDVITQNTK